MSFATLCASNVFCTEPFALTVSRLNPAVLSWPVPASPRTVMVPGLAAAYVVPLALLPVCENCGPPVRLIESLPYGLLPDRAAPIVEPE